MEQPKYGYGMLKLLAYKWALIWGSVYISRKIRKARG